MFQWAFTKEQVPREAIKPLNIMSVTTWKFEKAKFASFVMRTASETSNYDRNMTFWHKGSRNFLIYFRLPSLHVL